MAARKRALFSLLRAGIAKHHRGNPAASLRVDKIFGIPVLLSGLASLCLLKSEENLLDQYFKQHLQRILKLHQSTPAPVVYLLAGSLPLSAQLHLRILSLFGQVSRYRDGKSFLAEHAQNVFSSYSNSSKSWFWMVRDLCCKYGLPHPAKLLLNPPTKTVFKKMCRLAILSFHL